MRSGLSHIGEFGGLFKEAGRSFVRNNMSSMASAIAYDALLSLAPLLLLLVGAFRLLVGVKAVEEQIILQVGDSLGPKAVPAVSLLLDNITSSRSEVLAVGGGTIALLIIFSTGFLRQFIQALNVVWKVGEAQEGRRGFLGGILQYIRTHFFASLMLVCIGLYLYASVLMKAVSVAQGRHLIQGMPVLERLFPQLPHLIGSVALFPFFMLAFRVLPARRIAWKDVWCGALVTTVLFWAINRVIVYYLQHTAAESFYGAAGSFVIVLLWVYWAAMIILYGAEFTKAWAERYGTLRGK